MALTKISGGILDPGINVAGIVTATGFDGPFIGGSDGINAGIITCTELDLNGNGNISGNLVVEGNLTANGDFTTLNTTLREVELLRVDANATVAAGIITQRGSGDIFSVYDTSTQVFKIADGGGVGISTAGGNIAPYGNSLLIRAGSTVGTNKGHIMLTGDSATVDQGPQIVFSESGSGSSYAGGSIGFERKGDNSQGDLIFGTRQSSGDANTTTTEVVRVKSSGSVSIGNNPTVHSDTIFHVEKSSGETNVKFEGNDTMGARLSLHNNNTSSSANNQLAFCDAGGQSTSTIIGYNTDQTNNYGELVFATRSAQGTPPEERMRIHHDGEVQFTTAGYKFTENNFLSTSAATVNDSTAQFTNAMTSMMGSYHSCNNSDGIMDFTDYKASDWTILEVYGRVNPNMGGSGAYQDMIHMTIYKGVGYTYPNVVTTIFAVMHTPAARSLYSSGTGNSGNDGITAVWYNGSSESREFPYGNSNNAANYLRIKVPTGSFNTSYGMNFACRIFRRF